MKHPIVPVALLLVLGFSQAAQARSIECGGRIEPNRRAMMVAPATGTIESLRVQPGDRVARGDVLFALDSREAEILCKEAEAEFALRKARFEIARLEREISRLQREAVERERERMRRVLDEKGQATPAEQAALEDLEIRAKIVDLRCDQANATCEGEEARLDAAKGGLERARLLLDRTRVRAPIDGVVSRVLCCAGAGVEEGVTPMLEMFGPDEWTAVLRLDPAHLFHVTVGMPVRITLPDGETVLAGRLTRIEPAVEVGSGKALVRVELPALRSGLLVDGLPVRGAFSVAEKAGGEGR